MLKRMLFRYQVCSSFVIFFFGVQTVYQLAVGPECPRRRRKSARFEILLVRSAHTAMNRSAEGREAKGTYDAPPIDDIFVVVRF